MRTRSLACVVLVLAALAARGLSPAFTYQGRLVQGGAAPTGAYDFQCALYDAAADGAQVGATVTVAGAAVANGLFTLTLDFGAPPFAGADRWLAIAVRAAGGGSYTPLAPRQPLTPTPYALFANAVNWDDILNRPAAFGVYTAGAGLTLTGQQFAIAGNGVTAGMLAADAGSLAKVTNSGMAMNGTSVGIGTATAGFPLTFADTYGDKIAIWGQSGNSCGFGNQERLLQIHTDHSLADIAFGYGSSAAFTETVRIAGSGAVGIGTATPGFPLTFADTYGDKIAIWGQSGNSSGFGSQERLLQIHTDQSLADIAFGYGSSAAFTETVRITGTGSVGIGTATPGFPLTFADTYGDKIAIWGQSGNSCGFGNQERLLQIHTDHELADIAFGYGSSAAFTETMRIMGTGNVGIGTSTPAAKLEVNGTLAAAGFQLGSSATAGQVLTADAGGAGAWADLPAFWKQGGNAFGAAGVLGTTDNFALELRVNNGRIARLVPHGTSPMLTLGYASNYITSACYGSAIGGGGTSSEPNAIEGGATYGVIAGGKGNAISRKTSTANPEGSSIGGGVGNALDSSWCVIAGGTGNVIDNASSNAAIAGGALNNISVASYATIGGGYSNQITGNMGAIPGGTGNTVSGYCGAVGGGSGNNAAGAYSAVPGGYACRASGAAAFAAGYHAKATLDGAFVWGDYQVADLTAPAADTFTVRASGGVWLGKTSTPSIPAGRFLNTSTGGYLTTTGTWTNASDRALKTDFAALDRGGLLQALAALPITAWRYKANPGERHLGPTAQDFRAAFGLGLDDVGISTVDGIGVALAAAQALQAENAGMRAELAALRAKAAEVDALRARLEKLEAAMARVLAEQ